MKRTKRVLTLVLLALLMLTVSVPAYAEDMEGGDWYVRFTSDGRMDSNFRTATGMSDILTGLQPGDNATFYMELSNEHASSTDWYMTNKVLESLEASQDVAQGGAYSYDLRYVGPSGQEDVLYTSSSIGGEGKTLADRIGLREATSALEDFFYLDTLKSGEKGKITLNVALDGETQGNTYQDTLARLQMNFAVELTRDDTTPSTWRPVRTGDETNMMLWSGIMLGCGVAALVLAVVTLRRNRKDREEDEDE